MGIEALWYNINKYISIHGKKCTFQPSEHIYFDFTSSLIRIFNEKYKNYTSLYHILEGIIHDIYSEFEPYLQHQNNKLYVFLDTRENLNISFEYLDYANYFPSEDSFKRNQNYDFQNHFQGHTPYVHKSCITTEKLRNNKIVYRMTSNLENFLYNVRYQSEIEFEDDFSDYIPLSIVSMSSNDRKQALDYAWLRWLIKCGAKLETKVERREQRYRKEYTEFVKQNYKNVPSSESFIRSSSHIFVQVLPDGTFQRYYPLSALPNGRIEENSISSENILCFEKIEEIREEYHPQFCDVLYCFDYIIRRLRESYPSANRIKFFKCTVENDFTIASHIKQNNIPYPTIISSDSDMFVHLCDYNCQIETLTKVVPGTDTPVRFAGKYIENPEIKQYYIPTSFFWSFVFGSPIGCGKRKVSPIVARLMCVCLGTDYNPNCINSKSFAWFKDQFCVNYYNQISDDRMFNFIEKNILRNSSISGKVSIAINLYINYFDSEFIEYQ